MKNPNDAIQNRTHDLPICSAVPEPTAALRICYRMCAFEKLGFKDEDSSQQSLLFGCNSISR
jgi:hypothetical protein